MVMLARLCGHGCHPYILPIRHLIAREACSHAKSGQLPFSKRRPEVNVMDVATRMQSSRELTYRNNTRLRSIPFLQLKRRRLMTMKGVKGTSGSIQRIIEYR